MTTRSELDLKFIAAVDRLGRALRVARQQIATNHQLSLLQLQILEHMNALGPRRVGQLAHELDLTQPTVSDALGALEQKKIVRRSRDSNDGRATVVTLTASGATLAVAARDDLAPLFRARRASSDEDQAAALAAILEEILHLQDRGVISINRSCPSCTHYQAPGADGAGYCRLLDMVLHRRDLRVDCAEHLAAV